MTRRAVRLKEKYFQTRMTIIIQYLMRIIDCCVCGWRGGRRKAGVRGTDW